MFRITCCVLIAVLGIAVAGQDLYAKKKYRLHQSDNTDWWGWTCKDGSKSGWSPTKDGARSAAVEACGTIDNSDFTDPLSDAYGLEYDGNNNYVGILVQTLDNNDVFYEPDEMSESAAFYINQGYTEDPNLTVEEIVAAQLNAWGIYLGGETRQEIIDIHNLTEVQFDMIVAFDYEEAYVTVENGMDYLWEWY